MFIPPVLTRVKSRTGLHAHSAGEWIKNMWGIFRPLRAVMSFAGKWMELEIMLSEVSQSERQVLCVFSHV
jgi:hypothetical protein